MKRTTLLIALMGMIFATASVQAKETLSSPNKAINIELVTTGSPIFKVTYSNKLQQKPMAFSIENLGMKFNGRNYTDLKFVKAGKTSSINEKYPMPTGKKSQCENHANECAYVFSSADGEIIVRMRAYNDGITFRYEVEGLSSNTVADETTVFNLEQATNRWIQTYDPGYERYFPLQTIDRIQQRNWSLPALFEFETGNGSSWMLLSESNIEANQSAMWIDNAGSKNLYKVVQAENKVALTGSWHTSWRVGIIGTLADVVESTLIEDSSAPNQTGDFSWVKPGIASWIYWAYNHGSQDYKIVTQYIDMAKALNLKYTLIDWEWDLMHNGGNIDDAINYANQQGVKLLLWYNSSTAWITDANGPQFKLNTPESRENEFSMLESKGIAGVKIDFFAGDKEEVMRYCQDILRDAAKHHLLVNLHGAPLPRGWRRTFPNLVSTEGVLGAEWYNNGPQLTNQAAAHNATLPFTRNVVGPMDYTPCTFSDSQFPHITTDAHELALTALFESGIQHLADKPESYLSQPKAVQDYLTHLPAAWDDIKFIDGYPGRYAVIARRSGNTWYVAGINGLNTQQSTRIDWSFLSKSKAKATMFFDVEADGTLQDPDKTRGFAIGEATIKSSSAQSINMRPRGGFVIVVNM